MLNITLNEVIDGHIIFGRNIPGKKYMTACIKFKVFSCINQFRIQKRFSTISTVGVSKKASKKFFQYFFHVYFMSTNS